MFKLLRKVIISGHPGTGTTSLLNKLASLYHLKQEQRIKIGDLFRQNSIQKTGSNITGFYQREISEDLSIDTMQTNLILDPNPQVIFILESRLGGILSKKLKDEGRKFEAVTILITTDEKVRLKRVFERDHPDLDFDKYTKLIKEREEKDFKQWMSAHPFLTSNPLNPTSASLYDLHIDNTNLNLEETVQEVNKKLLQLGAVKEVIEF